MNKPLISVIVPVYNAEKFLRENIASIQNQTWENLEILLIDDGSKDSSPQICDELQSADSRIRVIHQLNQGMSAARNAGLSEAQGEYVGFMDNDDFIHPQMFEILYKTLVKYQADVAGCSVNSFFMTDGYPQFQVYDISSIPVVEFDQEGIVREMLTWPIPHKNKYRPRVVWNKLWRKSVIKDLRFERICAEDQIFSIQGYLRIDKLPIVDVDLYYNVQRQESYSKNKNTPYYLTWMDGMYKIYSEVTMVENQENRKIYQTLLLSKIFRITPEIVNRYTDKTMKKEAACSVRRIGLRMLPAYIKNNNFTLKTKLLTLFKVLMPISYNKIRRAIKK